MQEVEAETKTKTKDRDRNRERPRIYPFQIIVAVFIARVHRYFQFVTVILSSTPFKNAYSAHTVLKVWEVCTRQGGGL